MVENNINVIETNIDETTIEAIPPPPPTNTPDEQPEKRKRGRPKGSTKENKLTADPNYFKNYYNENLKNVYSQKVECQHCKAKLSVMKLDRHQKTSKYCNLIRRFAEQQHRP